MLHIIDEISENLQKILQEKIKGDFLIYTFWNSEDLGGPSGFSNVNRFLIYTFWNSTSSWSLVKM